MTKTVKCLEFFFTMTVIVMLNGPIFQAISDDIGQYLTISGDIGRYPAISSDIRVINRPGVAGAVL